MSEKENKEEVSNNNDKTARPPLLEWIVSIIGASLVFGTIGFLIVNTLLESGRPPELSVEKNQIVEVSGGYLVKFLLENKGDANAAAVMVEGKLMDGEKEVETSSATLSYAPSKSKREGGLLFTHDPARFGLSLRATGYENP